MIMINLDLDGVLADFDKGAIELFGMSPHEFEEKFGIKKFWKTIFSNPTFFYDLDPMPDAMVLWDYVRSLDGINLNVITGVPAGFNREKNHKREWVAKHLGEWIPVTCCFAREKADYCNSGDILIDDRIKYKHLWEAKGGKYIVHTSAVESIRQLKELGFVL